MVGSINVGPKDQMKSSESVSPRRVTSEESIGALDRMSLPARSVSPKRVMSVASIGDMSVSGNPNMPLKSNS
jgi:hypothetical protein